MSSTENIFCQDMIQQVLEVQKRTIFECICNILEAGLKINDDMSDKIATILEHHIEVHKNASITADSNDIIKAIAALHLLGRPHKITYLIEAEGPDFASNCTLLLGLIHTPEPALYNAQIIKYTQRICDEWWISNALFIGDMTSQYHIYLLASQALIRTLHLYDVNQIDVPNNLLLKAIIVLFQILLQILEQLSNGSWDILGSDEQISYAIIALTYLACLPFMDTLSQQIEDAIQQGRSYLEASVAKESSANQATWLKMDSIGAENIRRSFIFAALNTPLRHCVFGSRIDQLLVNVSMEKLDKFSKFFAALPLFKGVDEWRIRASLIEGCLFMPELSNWRCEIFTGKGMNKDKYLDYIPFSFLASARLMKYNMSPQNHLNMMICFMLIFQADEFFDGHVVTGDFSTMARVRKSVETIFSRLHDDGKVNSTNGVASQDDFDQMIYHQLDRYVRFILSVPQVQKVSKIDRTHLELELKALLLANIQQCEDNLRLQRQISAKVHSSPPSTYSKWVRSTAADHVTFPYAFAFLIAILSNGEDFLKNIQIRYAALECVERIAVRGRMINDYSSLSRDRKEMNLNSVFFPEFEGETKSDEELCTELMNLVNYEKRHLEFSFEQLKGLCASSSHVYDTVRFFDTVLEFFNQVYERRDISNWL